MKKFIFIDYEPWTVRRKELFYDLFVRIGIPLTVWNLSQWLYPGVNYPDEIKESDYLVKVENEEQFKQLLNKENPYQTIIIEEIPNNWYNRKVFKYLSDYNYDLIKIDLYGNALLSQENVSKWKYLKLKNIPLIIHNKINLVKLLIYNKIHKVKNKKVAIISSNAILPRTHNLNHPDYEQIKFREIRPVIDGDYIVFCDNYFPYHPDLRAIYKYKTLPDGKLYQNLMKSYFDFLESKYKMPVVIAAHPKSDYKGGEFGNRKVIKYQTQSLVKYSKMVTLHVCNTTSYAVICDKPIAFVTTNDYISLPHIRKTMDMLARNTLGLPYFNIEDENYKVSFSFNKVSPVLRKKYIYNYLTSIPTEDTPNEKTLREILIHL